MTREIYSKLCYLVCVSSSSIPFLYTSGSVHVLLKSNSDNVAVDNTNVESVEINRKQIMIKTNGKTFKYGLSNPDVKNKNSDVYDSYVQVLQTALGSKVVSK